MLFINQKECVDLYEWFMYFISVWSWYKLFINQQLLCEYVLVYVEEKIT